MVKRNKPGPAQVGAISKAQKWQKDFQVSIYSTRKSKNQKSGPSGAPGPANASLWRAKMGGTSEIVNIFVAVEGGPFGEKTNFRKKSLTMSKNRKGGPFGIFQHPFCRKTSKKCRGTLWEKISEKNVSQCQKNERGTLWCCPVWYVTRKNRENLFGPVR